MKTSVCWNIKSFSYCLIFSHTLLLWAFLPYKKISAENLVPRTSTHAPSHHFSLWLDEPSTHYFSQSIRNVPNNFSFFNWFSSSELQWHVHFPGVMVFSSTEVLKLWYPYHNNNDEFNPRFDIFNSETNDLCFVTQENILVLWRYISHFTNHCKFHKVLKFSWKYMWTRWIFFLNWWELIQGNKYFYLI